MAREFTNGFYDKANWKKCRNSFVSKRVSIDGGLCERCKKDLGVIVHHKIHITPKNINDPMITLNHDNLEFLCMECHAQEHMGKQPTREGLRFNEQGDLIEI